jgi:RND family efflux transporter MFP subunit
MAIWLWRSWARGVAGRPVPAPRTVSFDEPAAGDRMADPTGALITLAQELAERAGLKIVQASQRTVIAGGSVAVGVVQVNAYRTSPVISLVGGILRNVGVELGQRVSRGQQLAVVYSNDLAMAESNYLKALAELEEHHKHHLRTEQLIEIGAASREEFDQATNRFKSAEADVESMRQRLLFLGLPSKQIETLRSPNQIVSEVGLVSPISGIVINRAANTGEVIEANKELLRVADLASVWVVAQVYEKDLAQARVGMRANVTTSAWPGRAFRGRVSYVDPSLDPATRTVQVRVDVNNAGESLKLGMFVNVSFGAAGEMMPGATSVPAISVQTIGDRQAVFVATNNPNTFALRLVRLGPELDGSYVVIEGLNAGERVVTDGSFLLRAEWLKLHPGESILPPAPQPSAASVRPTMMAKKEITAKLESRVQTATIEVNERGFEPASVILKLNVPARVTFTRRTDNTCAREVVIRDFGINRPLPLGDPVVVEFTPNKIGEIIFTCAMSMQRGKFVVKER